MSRLPRLALAAALLPATLVATAAASCNGGGGRTAAEVTAPEGSALALETLVQQSIPGQTGATVREVVRDEAAWQALWSELRQGSALPAEPPAVDFSRDMVIVAAMETQGCVSRVTIRSAELQSSELVVDVLEAPPAPNCICITSERPIHAVRLPRVDAPARFAVERGRTDC